MKQNKTLLETMNILRGIFMFILTTVTFSVFSQVPPPPPPIDINAITTGYYNCYVDGKFIDKHTDRAKATTHCASLKANNPDALIGFDYPEFTQIKVSGYKTIEVDTIQVIRQKYSGWTNYYWEVDLADSTDVFEQRAFLAFHDYGCIDFKTDTIYSWQSKYNFKRTKTFGKISYENLDIPFQFIDVWSDKYQDTDKDIIWCKATDPYVRITSWIDGEIYKEFKRPDADGQNPFFFGIPKTGEFKMEVENKAGEIITYSSILKL